MQSVLFREQTSIPQDHSCNHIRIQEVNKPVSMSAPAPAGPRPDPASADPPPRILPPRILPPRILPPRILRPRILSRPAAPRLRLSAGVQTKTNALVSIAANQVTNTSKTSPKTYIILL
ncbi:hypothetical protein ACJJTC_019242 [Scirpophaga incertulas]